MILPNTTKYYVSDFQIPDIQIVILYENKTKIEIFIQILNFIKLQGIFNKSFICRTLEVKKFYNTTYNGHTFC